MRKLILATFTTIVLATPVLRAECEITINRTACPGKETEAYKPYSGKNPTVEKSKATSADACLADADKNVKIVRKGTLAKKVATAKFDGKEIGTKEDAKDCK